MKNTLLLYIMIFLLSNCVLPIDKNYDIVEETTVSETDEIIIIQEVHSMELQPIKEYEGYVKSGVRVFGIVGDELEEIKLFDTEKKEQVFSQFFLKDGMIYLSVKVMERGDAIPDTDPVQYEAVLKEYLFKQVKGKIETALSIPDLPPSERVQFSDTKFQINNTMYGDLETSKVLQMPAEEAYKKVDGFKRVDTGLWFSVPETYSSRKKGVYFWGVGAGGTTRVKNEGRIW